MAKPESLNARRVQDQDQLVFQQLDDYPWDSDVEFQSGLRAILGPNPSPDQAEHLTLRARCFFFSRKNSVPVEYSAYQSWREQLVSPFPSLINGAARRFEQPSSAEVNGSTGADPPSIPRETSTATNSTEPPAPYPTSFTQIVELITNGQPIPGIRDVPGVVLEGQASQSSSAKRKKPWERHDAGGGDEIDILKNAS